MFAHPFLSIKQLHVKRLDLDSCQILHVCWIDVTLLFKGVPLLVSVRCNPEWEAQQLNRIPGVMISLLKPSMNIGCRFAVECCKMAAASHWGRVAVGGYSRDLPTHLAGASR